MLPVNYAIPMMRAALKSRRHIMDSGMSLSEPHPTDPYNQVGKLLGSDQFALHDEFEKIGRLALLGQGIEPGMADYYARYAADHFFDEIDEIGIRDGATLELPGHKGMAFVFSIWVTIEECTNPAVVWDADARLHHRRALQRARELLPAGRHRLPGDGPHRARRGRAHRPQRPPAQERQEGELQVRRRAGVRRRDRRAQVAQPAHRPTRSTSAARRSRRATSSPPSRPIPPSSARVSSASPRRAPGSRARRTASSARSTCTSSPTPRRCWAASAPR